MILNSQVLGMERVVKVMKQIIAGICVLCLTVLSVSSSHAAEPNIKSGKIVANGVELHYREAGEGAPVIFLHALFLNSRLWLDQVEGLSGTCRCIALDLRGFGESEPYTASYLDPYIYADDIVDFIAAMEFDAPVHLVGLSAGGLIAGLVYEKAPEKVASITLISASFDWTPDPTLARYQREMARLAVVEGKDILFRRFDEYTFGPTASLHARARYKSMLEEARTETIVAFLGNGGRTKPRPDLYDMVDVPVLLPVGTADSIISLQRAEEIKTKLKHGVVHEIKDGGRLLPLENADALNRALKKFWRSIEAD